MRLAQILEAFYVQGKKDGARAAFDQVEGFTNAREAVPHAGEAQDGAEETSLRTE